MSENAIKLIEQLKKQGVRFNLTIDGVMVETGAKPLTADQRALISKNFLAITQYFDAKKYDGPSAPKSISEISSEIRTQLYREIEKAGGPDRVRVDSLIQAAGLPFAWIGILEDFILSLREIREALTEYTGGFKVDEWGRVQCLSCVNRVGKKCKKENRGIGYIREWFRCTNWQDNGQDISDSEITARQNDLPEVEIIPGKIMKPRRPYIPTIVYPDGAYPEKIRTRETLEKIAAKRQNSHAQ